MAKIIIDKVRISNFRGLDNFGMSLLETTVLTGMNNVGKTTVLKALQIAFGSSNFLTTEDLHLNGNQRSSKIIVDTRIIPIDNDGKRLKDFSEEWEMQLKADSIKYTDDGFSYMPLRTVVEYNNISKEFRKQTMILSEWEQEGIDWTSITGTNCSIRDCGFQFSYIDAHRDIIDDMKSRSSYLGRLLSDISQSYNDEDLAALENTIEELNKKAVENSDILSLLKSALSGIETTMDEKGAKVNITPFSKKIRDLNKGVSIEYGSNNAELTMDYHGMGTRSWASMLSFKAFLKIQQRLLNEDEKTVFPIIAIEEPESHLHPNAQKLLFKQMVDIPGQKIISTHSASIASQAPIRQLRGLYRTEEGVRCGSIEIEDKELLRRIKQKVIHTKGEILFSKALILFEGETEEQALPIFANQYFGEDKTLNMDFVGVGGAGQYLPFLKFAESLNIPWYIFSDGEEQTIKKVQDAVKKLKDFDDIDIKTYENIFIIPDGGDFESMLLQEGYKDEVELCIKQLKGDNYIEAFIKKNNEGKGKRRKTENVCKTCHQDIYEPIIKNYCGDAGYISALEDIMSKMKTDFSASIGYFIEKSEKGIPPLIEKMLKQIDKDIYGTVI